jgi:hypothetical protein
LARHRQPAEQTQTALKIDQTSRLLSAQPIVGYNPQLLLMPQLLANEIDQILHTFKLALAASADMLDTPAPSLGGWQLVIVDDKPEQKRLDTPVAHDRNS